MKDFAVFDLMFYPVKLFENWSIEALQEHNEVEVIWIYSAIKFKSNIYRSCDKTLL